MSAHNTNTGHEWIAPDDAPELTDAFFETADEYRGGVLVKTGGQSTSTATPICSTASAPAGRGGNRGRMKGGWDVGSFRD